MKLILSEKAGEKEISWSDFKIKSNLNKDFYKKNVLTGFCDFISVDQIVQYISCFEAGGIPVFLSHPSVKTSDKVFSNREKIWKTLGIKNFVSPYIKETSDETIENCNISFVQLSSGTTSSQKGFGITEKKLRAQIEKYAKACGITKDSVIVSWLPLYHDMGLITSLFLPYIVGCKTVIIPTFDWLGDYDSLFREINKHNGTHCWLPNFCFDLLSESKEDLNSFCNFVNCSEMCRSSSMDKFINRHPKAKIHCCYALAENVFAVSQSEYDGISVSCGKPLDGTDVRIADNGEIFIDGDCLFDATLVDGKFIPQKGEYSTGDIGKYNTNGEISIMGRIKEIAKLNGKQVFLPDVDKEINEQSNVSKGRVVSLSVENKGTEKLVVLYEGPSTEIAKIRQIVMQNFEVSSEVINVPDGVLKKTSSGKLSRPENLDIYSLLKVCASSAGFPVSVDTRMKSDGILDSFTVMEVLNEISFKLKKPINWQFDFSTLDTPLSFLEALK